TFAGEWPHFFVSTRYLNVLHKQRGPIDIPQDIARKAKEEYYDDSSSEESADHTDTSHAMAIAQPLIDSLSCIALLPQSSSSRQTVSEARDLLREAARAAGVSRSKVLVKGFWIALPMTGAEETEMHFVDVCGVEEEIQTIQLHELMSTAHQ
ncbi:unnamed protein product, partial [Effrenium voratum]